MDFIINYQPYIFNHKKPSQSNIRDPRPAQPLVEQAQMDKYRFECALKESSGGAFARAKARACPQNTPFLNPSFKHPQSSQVLQLRWSFREG